MLSGSAASRAMRCSELRPSSGQRKHPSRGKEGRPEGCAWNGWHSSSTQASNQCCSSKRSSYSKARTVGVIGKWSALNLWRAAQCAPLRLRMEFAGRDDAAFKRAPPDGGRLPRTAGLPAAGTAADPPAAGLELAALPGPVVADVLRFRPAWEVLPPMLRPVGARIRQMAPD